MTAPARSSVQGLALIVAISTMAACGGSSEAPSSATAPLGDGGFLLDVIGDSRACDDIKIPQAGTGVTVRVTATHDAGGTWIARPADATGGGFELRLTRSDGTASSLAGPMGPFDTTVAGVWTGSAINSFQQAPVVFAVSPSVAVFGVTTSVRGILRSSGRLAQGLVTSSMNFTGNGVSSSCPAGSVGWTINAL